MTFQEERLAKLAKIKNSLAGMETRSNEAMSTWQDGYGQDYVPTDLASTIINKVRDMDTLTSKLPAPIMMSSASYTIPVEWADPTWYASAEQANVTWTAVTTSKAGTDDITLVAKKYSMSTYTSWELDDDSIINIRTFLWGKISQSYAELLDKIVMHGDTTTWATWNVNSDDGAPAAWTYYLHQNWLFKSAIDNSKTVNAGTLDVADIRGARALLWTKGLDPTKLVMAIDSSVYYKLLWLSQVETIEKFGGRATITNWVLTAIDGVEVIPLSYVGKAEADGKISTTPLNNTLGRWLMIYKPDIITGFKRNLQVFTEYLPEYDQFRFTAHVRYAVKVLGTDSVSALINVTV